MQGRLFPGKWKDSSLSLEALQNEFKIASENNFKIIEGQLTRKGF